MDIHKYAHMALNSRSLVTYILDIYIYIALMISNSLQNILVTNSPILQF